MANFGDTILDEFPQKRILIIGDLVADQFLHGTIARVSREAPVFILRHNETDTRGGAAANAAVNVASLGGKPFLIGLTGDDENGRLLRKTLESAGVDCSLVVSDTVLKTTTKVRVLAGQQYAVRQQVIRIDYENSAEISAETRQKLIDNIITAGVSADAVIISDYDYGVADPAIFTAALEIARDKNIPVMIDSRFRLRDFAGAATATPNQDEVEQIIGKGFSPAQCEQLRSELGFESLLVTCGNEGMLLLEKDRPPLKISAVGPTEPVDVTGAGDTVIAAYSLALACGASFAEAAGIANHAGGIVVMKKGTASVSASELAASLNSGPLAGEFGSAA